MNFKETPLFLITCSNFLNAIMKILLFDIQGVIGKF